jgi:FHS family L-fucose permease-like MFS transporter
LMVLKAKLPEINPEEDVAAGSHASKNSVFDYPHLVLGVICIFTYVGVEVIAIDTIGLYGQFQGLALDVASKLGIYSLIALVVGYVLGIIFIPKHLSQRNALAICAALGFIFSLLAMFTSGWTSIWCIVLMSFGNALMWPSIWPLAIDGLGRFTKIGSALLIMGVVGGATLPLLYGYLADVTNRQTAYVVMLPLYLYILYYAMSGYRAGKTLR